MNLHLFGRWLVLAFIFVCPHLVVAVEVLSEYRLGTGDEISVHVFGERDLSMSLRLSDAGTISFPFLGELLVAGLTVGELEGLIDDGLRGDYLVDPLVNISVAAYRQFFINGEVTRPGGYAFVPGLTVRKAVALAGGFTERASRSRIEVISEDDLDGLAEQRKLNDAIRPGDVITVNQRVF